MSEPAQELLHAPVGEIRPLTVRWIATMPIASRTHEAGSGTAMANAPSL